MYRQTPNIEQLIADLLLTTTSEHSEAHVKVLQSSSTSTVDIKRAEQVSPLRQTSSEGRRVASDKEPRTCYRPNVNVSPDGDLDRPLKYRTSGYVDHTSNCSTSGVAPNRSSSDASRTPYDPSSVLANPRNT